MRIQCISIYNIMMSTYAAGFRGRQHGTRNVFGRRLPKETIRLDNDRH